jgi:hypothetical protein
MTKLTELTAFTPVATDLLYGVDDPSGTPVSGKITIQGVLDLISSAEGYGIMSVQAGVTGEATVDATPRKIAAWNTDGLSQNMTVDSTTGNDITADIAGKYLVTLSLSFSGSANKTFRAEIYKNGGASGFASSRKLGGGGDEGTVDAFAILALAIGDTVSVFQSSTDGGSAMTVTEGQLLAHRIGE